MIAVTIVEANHVQVWGLWLSGMNGRNVSAAASMMVIRRMVKGIDHRIGGSLNLSASSSMWAASPA
ncbi:hypothetical protein ES707_08208 [subsurface metagenome]